MYSFCLFMLFDSLKSKRPQQLALFQPKEFREILFRSTRVIPAAFTSASTLLRQVCFGQPTSRFSCGFHSRVCLMTFFASFCSALPIHLPFLFLISVSRFTGACLILAHNCSLETNSGYLASVSYFLHFPRILKCPSCFITV